MANPFLSQKFFTNQIDSWDVMTLDWTINKSLVLILITVLTSVFTWIYLPVTLIYAALASIFWLILSLVLTFKKSWSSFLAPIYAVVEWVFIWSISAFYELRYPWIINHAVLLTFSVFFIMLSLYKLRILQPTQKFISVVVFSTLSIALLYFVNIIWLLTWLYNIGFIHDSWTVWVLFSFFVVWIASLNLIIDFWEIEAWSQLKLPKYIEWYCAFSLLVTLVWLYIEILRLLSKISQK